MKTYKDFPKVNIRSSDYATLILVGYKKGQGLVTDVLDFVCDGDYKAYIVTEDNVEIGNHYNKVAEFDYEFKIYDDKGLILNADNFEKAIFYRAGNYGCIIHFIGCYNDENTLFMFEHYLDEKIGRETM